MKLANFKRACAYARKHKRMEPTLAYVGVWQLEILRIEAVRRSRMK